MPFNFVAVVFTQINFLTDLVQTNCDFTPKTAVFAFLRPLLVGLDTTCDDHLISLKSA